jgi:capsular polysaccharide biosynthesis protein
MNLELQNYAQYKNASLKFLSKDLYLKTSLINDYQFYKENCIKKCISLIGLWDCEFFHFLFNYLIYFKDLEQLDTDDYKILLRQHERNSWQSGWIKKIAPKLHSNILYLNEGEEIYFEHLIMLGPNHQLFHRELDKYRILWLKNKIFSDTKNDKRTLILIKRSFSRVLKNWDKVFELCRSYCRKHNLTLDIFDDSSNLGSIEHQALRFKKAKLIIGSHGAGFINLIACDSDASLIEFLYFRKPRNSYDGQCYKKLCEILKIRHHSILVNKDLQTISIKELSNELKSL